MLPVFFENFISSAWTLNSKRSCLLVFLCQVIILFSLLLIGFVYVHSYIPNYNNKRFSKSALICTTVSDIVVDKCELTTAESRWDEIFHDEDENDGKSRRSILLQGNSDEGVREKNFMWSSCGEFCSTQAADKSGGCRQLKVNVRRPGSDLRLEECDDIDVTECGDELEANKEFDKEASLGESALRSIPDTVVHTLTKKFHPGIYKCEQLPQNPSRTQESINNCTSLEHLWRCKFPQDKTPENTFNCSSSSSTCLESPGFYICDSFEVCISIQNPESLCTRKCEMLDNLSDKNLIITSDKGTVITAKCSKAMHSQMHFEMWPRGFKNQMKPNLPPALFINCNDINLSEKYYSQRDKGPFSIEGEDCVNGTMLEGKLLSASATLKDLLDIWYDAMKTEDYLLDPIDQKYAPPEYNLSIYSEIPLYFTDFYYKKGCNMPPSFEECVKFYKKYGKVPDHLRRGQHLFPCFCRSTPRSTYCVAPNKKLFAKGWEDNLVEYFVIPYKILILTFLGIFVGVSFIFMCTLLYPLITDAVFSNEMTQSSHDLVGGSKAASVASGLGSRRQSQQSPSVFLTTVSPVNNYVNDVFIPRRESLFEKRS